MSFALVNPLGWAAFELLTSAQMNQLDQNMTLALDGGAGGVYTPSGTMELDGSAIAAVGAPTVLLRPATSGAALELRQTLGSAALKVSAPSPVNNAGQPANAVQVTGVANTNGPGAWAMYVIGGRGGSNGNGGYGGAFFGGSSDGNHDGGVGLVGIGGAPKAMGTFLSGAGVSGVGTATGTASVRGGLGVYGGGANGPAGGGPGGVFDAGPIASGVLGRGYGTSSWVPTEGQGAGGVFLGSTSGGGCGIYAAGGLGFPGGSFVGQGAASGLDVTPGASGTIAVDARGFVSFANADPLLKNVTAAVPMVNRLTAKNLVKAWGLVRDGVLVAGFNVSSVAINISDDSILDVTLSAEMASADYLVICGSTVGFGSNNPRWYSANIPGSTAGAFEDRTTQNFQIQQYGNGSAPFSTQDFVTSECYFIVIGEQT